MKGFISTLLTGASLVALTSLTTGLQATSALAAETTPPSADSSTTAKLGEVVVTARRQVELLQNVPQTVVPVTAQKLAALQIRDLTDLGNIVPGLYLGGGSFSQVQLRGVTFNNSTDGDSTVGFYLNDADIGPGDLLLGLFDIGQVETLKGPQGTNRGVSSPSGSITMTTHRPDLTQMGGYIDGTLQTHDGQTLEGGFGAPIIKDVFAVRVSGFYESNEGNDVHSIHSSVKPNVSTGEERISLRFTPTPTLEANLMYQHMEVHQEQFTQVYGAGDGDALNPAITPSQRRSVENVPGGSDTRYDIVTANVDYSFLGQQLSYVGGYNRASGGMADPNDIADQIPGANTYITTTKLGTYEVSNEIRLSRQPGANHFFDYTVGVYNRYEQQFGTSNFAGSYLPGSFGTPLGPPDTEAFNPRYFLNVAVKIPYTYRETSVFGNATLHLPWDTDVTGGLRELFYNFKANADLNTNPAFDAIPLPAPYCAAFGGEFGATYPNVCDIPVPSMPVSDVNDHQSGHTLLYSVEVSHRFSRNLMVYANTGTSFLRPTATIGLQGPFASSPDPLLQQLAFHPPQTSVGYEVGVKWTFLDNRGRIDLSAFNQKFKNFQIESPANFLNTIVSPPSVSSFFFPNSVNATVNGFDLDTSFRITPDWSVNALVSLADGKTMGKSPCNLFTPSGTPIYNTDGIISFCNGSGQVSTAPNWNASFESNYTRPLGHDIVGFLRGQASYYPEDDRAAPGYTSPSFATLNFYAGIQNPAQGWVATIFVKNALNNSVLTTRSQLPVMLAGLGSYPTLNHASNYFTAGVTEPLTVGVDIRYAFGAR